MNDNIILEDVADALNISLISDLLNINSEQLCYAINKIGLNYYTLDQWNYALSYISGRKISCESLDEISRSAYHIR